MAATPHDHLLAVSDASLQPVRKPGGLSMPSQANAQAFDQAVAGPGLSAQGGLAPGRAQPH